MLYLLANSLIAVNSDKKFPSVSMFSSLCALKSIYFFGSKFSLDKISDASISFKLLRNTSAIGDPVTYVLSFGSPHSAKYLLACSEYAKFTSEIISTILLFVSSGKHSSLHLFPASMWKIGMCNLFAEIALKHEFVSPKINNASGLIVFINL